MKDDYNFYDALQAVMSAEDHTGFPYEGSIGSDTGIILDAETVATIKFALKFAKIVTSEPSEGMVDAGYFGDRSAEGSLASYQKIFKSMISQAIQEIE